MPRSDRTPQARLQCRQSPDPQGAVREQTRCYALELFIAVDAKTATFARRSGRGSRRAGRHPAFAGLTGVLQPGCLAFRH